jgi:hypothetical protein
LPLEFTMEPGIFIFTDDSKEKISVTTLFLIFVIWMAGMLVGLAALAIEIVAGKFDQDRRNRKRKN